MNPSQDNFRDLVENFHDGIYFVDCDRTITYWNRGAEELTGYSADEVLGRRCLDDILCHVSHSDVDPMCGSRCPLAASMDDGTTRTEQVFLKHKRGHRQPVMVRTSPVRDARGVIVGGVEIFSDHSEVLETRQKLADLERMALLDPLSEIGNRRYFEMNLHARLDEWRRFGRPFGLLLLDLDHFKAVNDAHGHDIGDRVIRMVADTLAFSCRKSDVASRWGGEEFVLILGNLVSGGLREATERVRALVKKSRLPLADGKSLKVTVSGGATWPVDGDTEVSIIKRADALLYRSKNAGRDRISFDDDLAA
ncbi:MAG TPA: sensor domain-containing diguanylate cyclase [Gammaproteobacteria bacterium]